MIVVRVDLSELAQSGIPPGVSAAHVIGGGNSRRPRGVLLVRRRLLVRLRCGSGPQDSSSAVERVRRFLSAAVRPLQAPRVVYDLRGALLGLPLLLLTQLAVVRSSVVLPVSGSGTLERRFMK